MRICYYGATKLSLGQRTRNRAIPAVCERQKSQQMSEGATRTERMTLALTERIPASNNNIKKGGCRGAQPPATTMEADHFEMSCRR